MIARCCYKTYRYNYGYETKYFLIIHYLATGGTNLSNMTTFAWKVTYLGADYHEWDHNLGSIQINY